MSQPTEDPDLVDLSFEFQGLSISIRGSSAASASFLRGLSSLPASPPEASASPARHSAPSAASDTASSVTAASSETRDSILASFPQLPSYWRITAATQLRGSQEEAESRAKRAWLAGCWARATLDSRVSSPNRSTTVGFQNRCWCVLRSPRSSVPSVYTTSADFFAAVGQLQGTNTVCHAFASQVEARIYFAGARLEYPDPTA